ncbi:hypothetical protein AAEX63_13475 [Luteococcus sp. H138]|uniref:hypothetical protein n=1 Tax=unclassified Luteococcus TaxID=2639923 RepID=UPI00313C0AE6
MTESPFKPDVDQDPGPDMPMSETRLNPVDENTDEMFDASSGAADDARHAAGELDAEAHLDEH